MTGGTEQMTLKLDPKICSSRRLLTSALRAYAGHLPPESRFPSESALCREFGISRMTLNRALNDLVAEGILYARRGSGRFVAEKDIGRVYFVLPCPEEYRSVFANGFVAKDLLNELQLLAMARNISLTPLVASLTNRRDELDLEVFNLLPDGANVILPGYWYSGLFDLLRRKKCKVVFAAISASFDFLYEKQVAGWFHLEYDLSAAVELAMANLRKCNVKRAVLIDNDNHCLSPYQIGLKRALKNDFMQELIIYGGKENDFGANTLNCMLKARDRYPFEGIIAASPEIVRTVQEVLRSLDLKMPVVALKKGKKDDNVSFIAYPNKTVADLALKQLTEEYCTSGLKTIKPLFCEAGSTRNFLVHPRSRRKK